jgi:hypothetical protein
MTVDTALTIAGVVIGVMFALWGGTKFVKRINRSSSVSQKQNVDRGGTGIQSGRDTKL